jgi:hypothetical protein
MKTNNNNSNSEEGKEKKVAATMMTKKGTLDRFFSENLQMLIFSMVPYLVLFLQ